MKQKRFLNHLASIMKASLFLLICLSCSDENLMNDEKSSCEHYSEKIMEVTSFETTLHYHYYMDAAHLSTDQGLIYNVDTDQTHIFIKYEGKYLMASVCNFPKSGKKLKVPRGGITVILSGNVYQTLNDYNELVEVFELTQLKKNDRHH